MQVMAYLVLVALSPLTAQGETEVANGRTDLAGAAETVLMDTGVVIAGVTQALVSGEARAFCL